MNFKDNGWDSKAKSFYPRENQSGGQISYNQSNRNYQKIKNANIYDYYQQPYYPQTNYVQSVPNYQEYSEGSYINFGAQSQDNSLQGGLNKNAPAFKMKEYSTPQKNDYESNSQEMGGKKLYENLSEQKPHNLDFNEIASNVVIKPFKKQRGRKVRKVGLLGNEEFNSKSSEEDGYEYSPSDMGSGLVKGSINQSDSCCCNSNSGSSNSNGGSMHNCYQPFPHNHLQSPVSNQDYYQNQRGNYYTPQQQYGNGYNQGQNYNQRQHNGYYKNQNQQRNGGWNSENQLNGYQHSNYNVKQKYVVKQPTAQSNKTTQELEIKPFTLNGAPKITEPTLAPQAAVSTTSTTSTSGIIRKKYEMCKNYREKGACKYGDRCLFAHGDHELTKRGSPEPEKEKVVEKKVPETLLETVAEVTIETTKDSTKLQIEKSETETSKLTINKNDSGEQSLTCSISIENSAINGSADEEIQDQGENSTTLSTIENGSQQSTPEKTQGKGPKVVQGKGEQYLANFECFKKEEDFKELLENLDIENIEINLSGRPRVKTEMPINVEVQESEVVEQFNIEIEKLLSEEDDDEHDLELAASDHKQRRQSENISNQKQFSDNSLTLPISKQSSCDKAPTMAIVSQKISSNSENNVVSMIKNLTSEDVSLNLLKNAGSHKMHNLDKSQMDAELPLKNIGNQYQRSVRRLQIFQNITYEPEE